MATVLDIITGLNQAAANAYDGYKNLDDEIGLRREKGDPVVDSRLIDGFGVRFAGDKLIVTYQSDILMKEIHPRQQFENEIETRFGDIVKFLKKEYKKITRESISLTETSPADILVQSTSRVRNWVQATKQYKIGSIDDALPLRKSSEDSVEDGIRKFLDLSSEKRPSNDKRPKDQGSDAKKDK
mgnify:FL=1